jgi:actin, other eukaryote
MNPSPLVITNGTGSILAGFSGEDKPLSCTTNFIENSENNFYIGKETKMKSFDSKIFPMEYGTITNFEAMEKVWQHVFEKELKVSPEDQSILLDEAPLTSSRSREKMIEVMFETFKVPGLYITMDALLNMTATGFTNGVVMTSGLSASHVVPVVEFNPILSAIEKCNFGGKEVTQFLSNLLNLNQEFEVLDEIKRKFCQVSKDYKDDLKKMESLSEIDKSWELPDGNILSISQLKIPRIKAPESLFNSSIFDSENKGFHHMIFNSVMKTQTIEKLGDTKKSLFQNILLAGGNTLFDGISDRLIGELEKLDSENKYFVTASPDRNIDHWVGGSVFSSLMNFQKLTITKESYGEKGSSKISEIICEQYIQ